MKPITKRLEEANTALSGYIEQRDWLNAGKTAAIVSGLDEGLYLAEMDTRALQQIINGNRKVIETLIGREQWFDAARLEAKTAAMQDVLEAAEKDAPQ